MLWALRARLTEEEMAGILRPLARVIGAAGVALMATAAALAAAPSPASGVIGAAAIGLAAYGLTVRVLAPTEWTLAVEFATAPRQLVGT